MVRHTTLVLFTLACAVAIPAQATFDYRDDGARLTVLEDDTPVLVYNVTYTPFTAWTATS